MIRLFLASMLPSLIALITLPALAFSPTAHRLVQEQPSNGPRPAAVITLDDGAFSPVSVTVKAGQSVRWDNQDSRDYSLTADDEGLKNFKSSTLKPGKTWTHRFDTPGTYDYHCQIRPRAKGTVTVTQP